MYYPRGSGTETVDLLRKTKRDATAEKIESAIEKRIMSIARTFFAFCQKLQNDITSKIASDLPLGCL